MAIVQDENIGGTAGTDRDVIPLISWFLRMYWTVYDIARHEGWISVLAELLGGPDSRPA